MIARFLCVFLTVSLGGCASAVYHGRFKKDGFYYKRYGYSVCFVDLTDRLFIGKDWEVVNYTQNHLKGTFKIKHEPQYRGYKIVDRDNDGELEKEPAYIYDLKMEHMRTPGVIWVQTFELLPSHATKTLDQILKSYADSLQETGQYKDGGVYHKLKIKKEYKVIIEGRQYIKIRGNPAIVGTLNLKDTLRLKNDPGHKGVHLVVVLVKMSSLEDGALAGTNVLLIGYYNEPRFFSVHLKEFYRFLNTVRFHTRGCR